MQEEIDNWNKPNSIKESEKVVKDVLFTTKKRKKGKEKQTQIVLYVLYQTFSELLNLLHYINASCSRKQ